MTSFIFLLRIPFPLISTLTSYPDLLQETLSSFLSSPPSGFFLASQSTSEGGGGFDIWSTWFLFPFLNSTVLRDSSEWSLSHIYHGSIFGVHCRRHITMDSYFGVHSCPRVSGIKLRILRVIWSLVKDSGVTFSFTSLSQMLFFLVKLLVALEFSEVPATLPVSRTALLLRKWILSELTLFPLTISTIPHLYIANSVPMSILRFLSRSGNLVHVLIHVNIMHE